MAGTARRRIPEATVGRLPVYLRALKDLGDVRVTTVSSERLAEVAGVNAAKVRKDLSHLGSYGTRGVGYEVQYLVFQISRELGLTQHWPVVIVGIGNLGQALAKYDGFTERGFPVVALVDADRAKVGKQVAGLTVRHLSELGAIVAEHGVAIGVVATPAGAAQEVADVLVAAGVASILNFAPAVVSVPDGVSLRKVDLAVELQILGYYQQRRATAGRDDGGPLDVPALVQAAGVAVTPAPGAGPGMAARGALGDVAGVAP
jgi:redox-sensing transcriptional repressor